VETVVFPLALAVYRNHTFRDPTDAHGFGPSLVAFVVSYGNTPSPTAVAEAQSSDEASARAARLAQAVNSRRAARVRVIESLL
jgi:hypothetical protein